MAQKQIERWRVFRTHSGLTGFSIKPLKKNDEIIVPFGSRVPFAVRRWDADAEQNDGSQLFSLLDECYVAGVMNGELIDLWEAGNVKSTTYELR